MNDNKINFNDLLQRPLFQLTAEEFFKLTEKFLEDKLPQQESEEKRKRYVYGIAGIAEIFNCSQTTAQKIKNSGKIDESISQVGRKIIVDVDKAIELFNLNNK